MEQDFFTYLPPEMTINILSRLPVRTAVSCKCVRKSWRSLIETPEFVKCYKSVTSLAVFEGETSSIPYKVYELEDELNLEKFKNPCNVAFKFSLPQPMFIQSSANGLLLLSDLTMAFDRDSEPKKNYMTSDSLVVCNPVTHEFISIPDPASFVPTHERQFQFDTFGFGVSKATGQYKIVRVFGNSTVWEPNEESHCQVYTLGTGLWRSIAPNISLKRRHHSVGALLNGNFHWLASDLRRSQSISCFDLETELFSTFSPPPLDAIGCECFEFCRTLFASSDCLGLCDDSIDDLVVWLMNTYGDGESWTKQFVLVKISPRCFIDGYMCVIKVFKDGDVMMKVCGHSSIMCYSDKTETIQDLIEHGECTCAVCYTPSFLRLNTFTMENVSSF